MCTCTEDTEELVVCLDDDVGPPTDDIMTTRPEDPSRSSAAVDLSDLSK